MAKYLSGALARRQALAAAAMRSRGARPLAMDAPFQPVPKSAGLRPALKQYAQLWCVPPLPEREQSDGGVGADVLLEAKSGVSDCSRTHPCSEKPMTINESHPEFLS